MLLTLEQIEARDKTKQRIANCREIEEMEAKSARRVALRRKKRELAEKQRRSRRIKAIGFSVLFLMAISVIIWEAIGSKLF